MEAEARIKTATEYHGFKFTGKRPLVITHGNGKTQTCINTSDSYGLRPSTDGKKFRLVTQKTGLTKVFTIPETTYKSLIKHGQVSRVRKVDYKVAAGIEALSSELSGLGINHVVVR